MILACLMSVDSLRLINISRAYEKTLYFKIIVAVFTSFIMLMSSDGHLKLISLKDLLFLSQFYSILLNSILFFNSVHVCVQAFNCFLTVLYYFSRHLSIFK